MLEFNVKTIAHNKQRYETVGDYYLYKSKKKRNKFIWLFRVSKLGDWRLEILIFVHEVIEWALVRNRGISVECIDRFDKRYEQRRKLGYEDCQGEPGDHKDSPYRKEHFFATSIERLLAAELKVDWEVYEKVINSL